MGWAIAYIVVSVVAIVADIILVDQYPEILDRILGIHNDSKDVEK